MNGLNQNSEWSERERGEKVGNKQQNFTKYVAIPFTKITLLTKLKN